MGVVQIRVLDVNEGLCTGRWALEGEIGRVGGWCKCGKNMCGRCIW